jgi:cytochrome c553
VFVALLASSSFFITSAAQAADADPAKGSTLYNNGDTARGIPACSSCHGDSGNSTIAANPKLAGQHQAYIAKQLTNFKSGERASPVMGVFAKQLTDEEIRNLAAFLNAQSEKPGAAKNKDIVDAGKKIYRAGIAEKSVPACAGCHGPTGAGIPAQFARLGGQHQDYTVAQLTAFNNGTRANNAIMTTIAKRMSTDEINAVADYIAGLR